jgi:putative transposase
MSRLSRNRLLYPGCYAHIISRSIRKLKLFKDDKDFEFFKELLIQAKSKAKFKIHHYCFMQTHFHLAVRMGDLKDFSFAIRDVKRDYACQFHTKYKLSGPIWRERFKSLLIEDEKYLYACGKYIEGNPVKSQLVKQGTDWGYSSSQYYELSQKDELVDRYARDVRNYKEEVMNGMDFESGSVIGSDFFRFQFFENRKRSDLSL